MESLEHLTIIWLGVLVAAFAARKTRLTPVLYYLAAGAVMVNLGFLPAEPDPFIRGFSEIGIILIMFALGFEENTSHFLTSVKRTWGIAFFGGLAPFLTAYAVADMFWGDAKVSLMVGLAMTATAVSLTMVSLKSEGLSRSKAATGIMTSAVLDDIASLALVAILVPIATGGASADIASIGLILGKVVLFFVIVVILAAWILPGDSAMLQRYVPFLRRFGFRRLLAFAEGEMAVLVLFLFAMAVGIVAHLEGFHPAVGAYMAGLIIKEEYFDSDSDEDVAKREAAYESTKRIVENVAFTWIGPVFFVELGTKILFDVDLFVSVIPQVLTMTGALFVAQIVSASLAARYTGGFSSAESLMIGFGMLGRAELCFVVLDIAYVQNSILTETAFYTLMLTAFMLNVAVPVTIRLWKPYFVRAVGAQENAGDNTGNTMAKSADTA